MTKREILSVDKSWLSTLYAVGKQPSIPLIQGSNWKKEVPLWK